MNRVSSIFSQLLQFFPRLEFEALTRKHNAERHARGFTCWQQFVVTSAYAVCGWFLCRVHVEKRGLRDDERLRKR